MVRDDWVWVWVQTVANGVAEAVANGSRQLGLSLGSDRREWFCWTVANGLQRVGLSLGSDRREWCCRTVANGFAGPSQMVIGDGLGVIGDDEARRRLGLGVRLDDDWV